ncbi:MAG: HD domain-containing protein [Planctomycetes bacterium]|nr:HD domain-containing protein [Planctomycetota bacterium]
MNPDKVLRDPVHNLITFAGEEGRLLLELIDRPEFQRLRRIRQLGLTFLAYPGAEHSRWVHSVGVCHLARRMLDALRARHGCDSEEYKGLQGLRREIAVAALLHDVGHGPFSHVFERAVPKVKAPPTGYPGDHEGWSERIIVERFGPVLRAHSVDVGVVAGLINKKNRANLLAKDFISSQLDADRMDYLLRDSRAAGPKYGEFDLEWLLHSLRIGNVKVRGQTEGVWRLCFDTGKAIHVIEEYIQARDFMYAQVYIHKTTRAYEAMLKNALGLATVITGGDPAKAPQPCPPALAKMLAGQPVSVDEYLTLDDFQLWVTLIDWSRSATSIDQQHSRLGRLCRSLVDRQQPYKYVDCDDRDKQDHALAFSTKVQGTLLEFSCHRDTFVDLAYRNAYYRKSTEHEEEEDRVIHVVDREGNAHPVETSSEFIKAISSIETRICRLYYDESDQDIMVRLRDDGWAV